MSQLQLMRILQFTTDDLRTNREGRLSALQRERFTPPKPNQLVVAVVFGHLLAIGGLLFVLALYTKSAALGLVMVIVVLLLFAPFGWVQQKQQQRPVVQDDIAKGKVHQACGNIILTAQKQRKVYYELTVDGITLEISAVEAAGFRNEGLYCVYYLPGSKLLLAAEALDG
jgi:DoxX